MWRGGFAPCHQRSDCERTIRRRSFGGWPAGRRTSTRAAGFSRWRRFETGWTEARRRRSGAWTARRLRDWVHRFNASGPDGLHRQLDGRSQASPVLRADGRGRPNRRGWPGARERRRRALAACRSQARHRRDGSASTSTSAMSGRFCKKLGFSHISARPRHPAQDERIVEAFKNVWPAPSARSLSRLAADLVCFNVSGLEELPPAMMEIRALRSS